MKHVYLNRAPDRIVDNKLMVMIAEFVISELTGSRILGLGVCEQIWTPRPVAQFPEVLSLDGSSDLLECMRSRITEIPGALIGTPVNTARRGLALDQIRWPPPCFVERAP